MSSRVFLKRITYPIRATQNQNVLECVSTSGVKFFCSQTNLELNHPITSIDEARRFMTDCLKAVGTPQDHAEIVADNLVEADYRGHYNHGMNRLEIHLKDIERGLCDVKAKPTVLKESVATALCSGNNGLGTVIGKICMDIAITKACTAGIGIVSSSGCHDYGIPGMYALQAIKKGYIGFSCTNTSPLMTSRKTKESAIGTNPISLGAPAKYGDSFVLDIVTNVPVRKIEFAMNEEEKIENISNESLNAQSFPLGTSSVNSECKGCGLGVFVEVLCGMLSGANFGSYDETAKFGQCFIAINPNNFADGFEERMTKFLNYLRKTVHGDSRECIMVAGDPERHHMEKVKVQGGLRYLKNQHETNLRLAKRLGVTPMG